VKEVELADILALPHTTGANLKSGEHGGERGGDEGGTQARRHQQGERPEGVGEEEDDELSKIRKALLPAPISGF
jgi:hypothetical protein